MKQRQHPIKFFHHQAPASRIFSDTRGEGDETERNGLSLSLSHTCTLCSLSVAQGERRHWCNSTTVWFLEGGTHWNDPRTTHISSVQGRKKSNKDTYSTCSTSGFCRWTDKILYIFPYVWGICNKCATPYTIFGTFQFCISHISNLLHRNVEMVTWSSLWLDVG